MSAIMKRVTDIEKSPGDKREYRGIELSNKLRIMLISDPETDKSAASMTVGVGSKMDPWELPGLAHFCEHMLFLGTEKYPIENDYEKFLSQNGGHCNASTELDKTNYYFNIKSDKPYDVLDRFVQFFLCPLFTESATEREVCVCMDSEFKNKLNDDGRRNLQVDRFLSKPGHDYGKFGTGNKQTLFDDAKAKGIEPREALLKFYEEWYSSNIMTCAILGKESLDELKNYISNLGFDNIKNKNVDLKEWTKSPYGPEQLGKKIHIVPINDTRSLEITFPIPWIVCEHKSRPEVYLGYLLGHGGPGSLQSELKKRGWTDSLIGAGENVLARGISVYYVEVDLSTDGLENVEEIIKMIFECIGMIRRTGYQESIQDELRKIREVNLRFREALKKFSIAMNTPSDVFHLPWKNKYIATNFDLKPRKEFSIHPQIIHDDSWLRCWFKQDDEFNLPKLFCKITIASPFFKYDPKNEFKTALLFSCINDSLNEEIYSAGRAGLSSSISYSPSGITIQVSGYNEKLPLLVEYILNHIVNFKPDSQRFNLRFELSERVSRNCDHESPQELAAQCLAQLIQMKHWSPQQLLTILPDISIEDVNNFVAKLFSAFHIQVFCYGNATKQEVLNLSETVCTILKSANSCRPLFCNELSPPRLYALENGDNYILRQLQSTHEVSAVKVIFQVGVQNNYLNSMVKLIRQLLNEPAYNQLRTVEQLGYTVLSATTKYNGTVGLCIYVQEQKGPDFVLDRIDAFLCKFRKDKEVMAAEEFQSNVEALISKLKVQPKTLYERFSEWDDEIEERQFDFDRDNAEINIFQKINKDNVVAFYDRKFVKDAPERQKIAVLLHGKNHSLESSRKYRIKREENNTDLKLLETPVEIECVDSLRDSLSLYGRPKPKLNIAPIGVPILKTDFK